MSDDRDIDEILASLDALLRESDAPGQSVLPNSTSHSSHNDDMPDESGEVFSDDADIELLDFTALDELEKSIKADADVEDVQSVEYLESLAVETNDAVEAPESNDSASVGAGYLRRVILTEEMLVDNQQVSLPLAFNDKAEGQRRSDDTPLEPAVKQEAEQYVEEEIEVQDEYVAAGDNQVLDEDVSEWTGEVAQAEETERKEDVSVTIQAESMSLENDEAHVEIDSNADLNSDASLDSNGYEEVHAMHVDKQDIENLLELVSMDVSYQIHRILPNMIRESLHEHLADMQQESARLGKTNKFNSNQDENS